MYSLAAVAAKEYTEVVQILFHRHSRRNNILNGHYFLGFAKETPENNARSKKSLAAPAAK
jgi:hypothetical protein